MQYCVTYTMGDAVERFVEFPGIVEIHWVSDDPSYYVEPMDLFEEQENGLPEWYGKKDMTTTEMAYFTCHMCMCDMRTVATLRAHCKATQHIRKVVQKEEEPIRLEQENGLPDWRDETTTEMGFFACNVCKCDMRTLDTFMAHCEGTMHIRKAAQEEEE